MTYAYFYLLGQNIAYLTTTWKVSAPIILLVAAIAAIASGFTDVTILGLFFGWASVAYIVEKKVQVDTRLLHFNQDPTTHFHGLVLAMEIIFFAVCSLILLVDDGSVVLWLLIMLAHALYVFVVFFVNKASKKIDQHRDAVKFFFVYFMILAFTDSWFVILSMIVHDRRQNIIGIVVVTLLSQLAIYFLNTYDIDRYFPRQHVAVNYDDDNDNNDQEKALSSSSSSTHLIE